VLIAFVGDVHGRMFHALAALVTLQERLAKGFDLVIQVGDLGFPDPARADEATKRYLAVDPSERDLGIFLNAAGAHAEALRAIRERLGQPLLFVRGNHEDFAWLAGLPVDTRTGTAPADPFDLLHYVPDGTVLDRGGVRIAFLGGVEELPGEPHIDAAAYDALLGLAPGSIDVLVSHEGPYGSGTRYGGETAGSPLMSRLLAHLEPRHHVFGHMHQLAGPRAFGPTTYLGLDGLVASALWHPEARGLKPGCLGVLDTATGKLTPITDAWLADFPTPLEFDRWCASAGLAADF
jgi:Icc-related predicted phosphoesterase